MLNRKAWLLLLLGILPMQLMAQALFKEGVHYQRLANPQPVTGEQIEVIEFFWYGCPHCAEFEPFVQRWKRQKPENVKLTLVPAVFRKNWIVHAQAYYAAEILGVLDKTHTAMFVAMHQQQRRLTTAEQIADFVAELGVDREAFLSAMNSFAVDSKVRNAMRMIQDYRIQGVPAMAVNGEYLTSGSMAGDYANMLNIVDFLATQVTSAEK